MKKKIAFLILAHTDYKQLHRLITALDDERFDLYIHVDKKKNIKDFKFNNINMKYGNLYICSKRYNVVWGDISIVEATLQMYKQAFENYSYCRYVTLSGLDYPIMSNNQLWNILSREKIEYIGGEKLKNAEYMRVDWPYFWNNRILFEVSKHIVGFKPAYWLIHLIRHGKHKKLEINGKKSDIFFSPQWHALSGEFVKYMLNTLKNNSNIMGYFKHTFAPDEMLIPTILFNSEFRNIAIENNYPEGTHYNQKCVTHYINYEPQVEVFNECKYEDIKNSRKMFTRKVRSGESDKLCELLDENRDKIEN